MVPYAPLSHLGKKWPEDYNDPYLTRNPKRWLTKQSKLFAIGSCFAVNFGRWIAQHNVPIISPDWGLHYNSATIREELALAAGQARNTIIWNGSDSGGELTFYDAKRHPISAKSERELFSLIERIEAASRKGLAEAESFIITLGLSEIWEQNTIQGWNVLNRAPLSSMYGSENYRFRNRFQSIQEIKSDLRLIVEAINDAAPVRRPIVFTVSPVPLKTTGATFDSRIANTRSKSLIITALHDFLDDLSEEDSEQISYFPAYEMFQYFSSGDVNWQRDGRHVTAQKLDSVCRQFTSIFSVHPEEFNESKKFDVPIL